MTAVGLAASVIRARAIPRDDGQDGMVVVGAGGQGLTRRAAGGLPSRVVGTTSEKRTGWMGCRACPTQRIRSAHEQQTSQRPARDRIAIAPFQRAPESCSAIPHAVFGQQLPPSIWARVDGRLVPAYGVFGDTGAQWRPRISLSLYWVFGSERHSALLRAVCWAAYYPGDP